MPDFYAATNTPGQHSFGSSAAIRAEFQAIQVAFDKLSPLAGNALKTLRVNAGETGYEADPAVYLTSASGALTFVSKAGDTVNGVLIAAAAADVPLAARNTLLDNTSAAGVTGLWLGDTSSGVAVLQRSKRSTNTAGVIVNVEYGFSAPVKAAEFYRDGIDLFVAGVQQMHLNATTAQFTGRIDFGNGGAIAQLNGTGTFLEIVNRLAGGGIRLVTNAGAVALEASSPGVLTNVDGYEIGYRVIPRHNTYPDSGTIGLDARGKCITGGFNFLTVPANVFAPGDSFALYVDGTAGMVLLQGSGLTMRLAGSTTTGNRALVARAYATIWFNSTTECIVGGAGVS